MPETRIISTTYGLGGYDPTKPNNNIIEEVTRIVSDAELADEAEEKALAKADVLIDAAFTGKQAAFLKRLCKRLILKGSL